jgi:hypothetical protein
LIDDVADANVCVVVFVYGEGATERDYVGHAETRSRHAIQHVWTSCRLERGVDPSHVTKIHAEWEPSTEDLDFIRATFPGSVEITYSFDRPDEDGWAEALAAVRRQIESAADKK